MAPTRTPAASTRTNGEQREAATDRELALRLALPEGASAEPAIPADEAGDATREVETLILGAGVSGLAAAVALKRSGREDFVIVDRAQAVGGTWHHNRYPGCAVDIPSRLYEYSFKMNPDWGRVYAEQPELEAYLQRCARELDLDDHLSLSTELLDARWDHEALRWRIETSRGRFSARFFIIAPEPLHDPQIPEIPGLGNFRGEMFHSANWPEDDGAFLDGRRVAVIGTGASAVQFIPRIQPRVERLTVFQRTPGWVLPKVDWRTARLERWLMRRVPFLMRAARQIEWTVLDGFFMAIVHHPRLATLGHLAGRFNIFRAVRDRRLRRMLTPRYTVTCKRAMFSNEYYPALAQPNVEVVPAGVEEVREHSVLGADGTEGEVDTIIFGTGFHVITTHPIATRIRGIGGQVLADVWQGSPRSYVGTTISGFPNAFMMFGPNIGTLSGFVMAECQCNYITGALEAIDRAGIAAIDVREEEQERFNAEVDRALEGTTFLVGGCTSYYLDKQSRPAQVWPWTMRSMRKRLARFEPEPYETLVPHETRVAEPVGPAR